jgi:hypothetical protein
MGRSPDMPALHMYLWDYVNQIANSVHIHSSEHLKQRIRGPSAPLTPDVVGRVWQDMEYRLDLCTTSNGAYTEL